MKRISMLRSFVLLFAAVACGPARPLANVNAFHNPGAIVAHPAGRYLYVVNENFDYRDASGSVNVIDLQAVKASADAADPFQLGAIVKDSGRRIDSFAGTPAFDAAGQRIYLPTREADKLYTFAVSDDGGALRCGESSDTCGGAFVHDDSVDGQSQPYAAALASVYGGKKYLVVTHLETLVLTQYDVTAGAITGDAGWVWVDGASITSIVAAGTTGTPFLYSGDQFFDVPGLLSGAAAGQVSDWVGDGAQALTASPNGHVVYAALQSTMVAIDTTSDANGAPTNTTLATQDLSNAVSTLLYVDRSRYGLNDLLYATDFGDGSLSIFDAKTLAPLATMTQIGNGPFGLAAAYTSAGPLVALSLFSDDQVAVVDASAADPTQHQVTARIGGR
jgi:hypothetical protein